MNLQMSYELHRLYTFNNSLWKPLSGSHSASVLAHTGFYYSGNQATVMCYKCLCTIDCSALNESANVKHRQLSPNCLIAVGYAADNVLLVDPDVVLKKFSDDKSLRDMADKCTIAVSLHSSTVEVSLFKTAYEILTQALRRSQRRGVFADVESDIDRNNPDFDRLR